MREKAITAFVDAADSRNPEAAAAWVTQLGGDEKARNGRIEKVARYWLRFDETAARNWLNTVPLPDATKAGLLKEPVGQTMARDYGKLFQ